ncbi:restriction endonuclease subunit S, partial [Maribacter dokdonensis]
DLEPYKIDYQNAREITKADFIDTHKRTKLDVGDILLANSGHTIGKILYVKQNPKVARTTFQKSVAIIKPDNELVIGRYLYYNLLANVQGLKRAAVGSAQPNLLLRDLRRFKVEVEIELETQKQIAKVLSDLDAKIEVNNKINQELEAMAKTLYDYWFVQFDFPDANGKPYKSSGGKMVFNEALKREIPEGWEVDKVSSCCQIIDCLHSKKSDYIYEHEDYYLLQLENIKQDNQLDVSKKYYVSKAEYERWTTRIEVEDGDLVITNAGRVAGLAQIPKNVKAGIGRNITAIRPVKINPTFLYYTFQGAEMERQIKLNTDTGSFFKSLNVRGIKELLLVRAPKHLEDKFEDISLKHRRQRELNSLQNQKLSELRDWLLPMLMNGQVTVGEVEQELGMIAEGNTKYESL